MWPARTLDTMEEDCDDLEPDCARVVATKDLFAGPGVTPRGTDLLIGRGDKTDSRFDSQNDSGFDSGFKSSVKNESCDAPECSFFGSRLESAELRRNEKVIKEFGYHKLEDELPEKFKNLDLQSEDTMKKIASVSERKKLYQAFQQDEDGDTILHLVVICAKVSIIFDTIQLAPHPAFVNLQNNLLQTALHIAVLLNMPEVTRQLIVHGALVDIRDRRGNTALHIACSRGFLECAEELLRPLTYNEQKLQLQNLGDCWSRYGKTQDLNIRNYEGQYCVHLATFGKYVEILKKLVDYGACINAREGKSGRTPLHFAVEMQNVQLTDFLINYCQADTEVQTFAGLTPIQYNCLQNEHIRRCLLQNGAKDLQLPVYSDYESSSSDEDMMTDKYDCDFIVNGEPVCTS